MSRHHWTPEQALSRIMRKVRVDLDTRCWIYSGAVHANGYGATRWNGRAYKTHRLTYLWLRGQVADGLDLDHLCRNRACCNPFHLEPVTRSENLRRGAVARKVAA